VARGSIFLWKKGAAARGNGEKKPRVKMVEVVSKFRRQTKGREKVFHSNGRTGHGTCFSRTFWARRDRERGESTQNEVLDPERPLEEY